MTGAIGTATIRCSPALCQHVPAIEQAIVIPISKLDQMHARLASPGAGPAGAPEQHRVICIEASRPDKEDCRTCNKNGWPADQELYLVEPAFGASHGDDIWRSSRRIQVCIASWDLRAHLAAAGKRVHARVNWSVALKFAQMHVHTSSEVQF